MSAKLLSEDEITSGTLLEASTNVSSGYELRPSLLSVNCQYSFHVEAGEKLIAQVDATYRLRYEIQGTDQLAEGDLPQFAFANGTYHSWPFLRQLVFDFTSRLGFSPYTLPVFRFAPESKNPTTSAKSTKAPKTTSPG